MKKQKKKNYIGIKKMKRIFLFISNFCFSFVLYLKQFSIHENKTTEELLASIECCPKELLRRQKEISKGKLSNAYQTYTTIILR